MPQTIDVTGLPPDAIRAVEVLVSLLRAKAEPETTPAPSLRLPNGPGPLGDPEEWVKWWYAWCDSHPKRDIEIDDDRGSIYDRSTE